MGHCTSEFVIPNGGFLFPTASESRQDSAANLTSTNGSNSISMSVEINGIMYTGNTSTASLPRFIQESWATSGFGLHEPRHQSEQSSSFPWRLGYIINVASLAQCSAHSKYLAQFSARNKHLAWGLAHNKCSEIQLPWSNKGLGCGGLLIHAFFFFFNKY